MQSPENPSAQTDPNLIPHVFDIVGKTGIDHEILDQTSLRINDLSEHSAIIDVNQAVDIDGNGLVGILEVGDTALKIYGSKEDGKFVPGTFFISAGNYDPNPPEEEFDWAKKMQFSLIGVGEEQVFGRTTPGANRFGIDEDPLVSRNHFSVKVSQEGSLIVTDLESTNGTALITGENQERYDFDHIATETVHEIGTIATAEVLDMPDTKERVVGGVTFRLDGAVAMGGREAYAFSATDKQGVSRKIMVYRSNSEGGLRVGTGFEPDGRMMKGAESSDFFQYTQDTQLHPAFAQAVKEMTYGGDQRLIDPESLQLSKEQVSTVETDFENQVAVRELPDRLLATELLKLPAGTTTSEKVYLSLATDEEDIREDDEKLTEYIGSINNRLAESNLIPDFTNPIHQELDKHPLLGDFSREVFRHEVDGRTYEWHIANDSEGRVWVDRIRFADAEPSVYGTDDELVYSGILTSKPVEYTMQASGIDQKYQQSLGVKSYVDISRFLDTFEPVKRYRAQRNIYRADR
jgi:hypothetical protein